jgi:hypothetical protein
LKYINSVSLLTQFVKHFFRAAADQRPTARTSRATRTLDRRATRDKVAFLSDRTAPLKYSFEYLLTVPQRFRFAVRAAISK